MRHKFCQIHIIKRIILTVNIVLEAHPEQKKRFWSLLRLQIYFADIC